MYNFGKFLIVETIYITSAEIRACVRPLFLNKGRWVKLVYDVVGCVITVAFMGYSASPFVVCHVL